jgi:predicted TPR repeat methyltransferase
MQIEKTFRVQDTGELPNDLAPEEFLQLAICYHQNGALDIAEEIYSALVDAFPERPEPIHFLGLLRHQKNRFEEAIGLIEKAIDLAPDYADAHNNLGNIHNKCGRFDRSAECYRRALTIQPDNLAALNNLGLALKDVGRFGEAVTEFEKAKLLAPNNPEIYHNLGNVLTKMGKFREAATAYQRSIELRPYQSSEYENLCRKLYLMRAFDEGLRVVREWLTHDPSNPLALHRLAAFSGTEVPERASNDYVSMTFDSFAESFDIVLTGLEYKAPEYVGESLTDIAGGADRSLDILDAGCGTGLCSNLLRPLARRLIGVDLSEKMLEKADTRGDYDELIRYELTAFIGQRREQFDAIVSADTLVYFGSLSIVLQAMALALRSGGLLVFTLEKSDKANSGYQINPHGRYSHTERYLRTELEIAGFEIIKISTKILRFEGGLPVNGLVVTARKHYERERGDALEEFFPI